MSNELYLVAHYFIVVGTSLTKLTNISQNVSDQHVFIRAASSIFFEM